VVRLDNIDHDLVDFVSYLLALRRDHPSFRRRQFFQGKPRHGDDFC